MWKIGIGITIGILATRHFFGANKTGAGARPVKEREKVIRTKLEEELKEAYDLHPQDIQATLKKVLA